MEETELFGGEIVTVHAPEKCAADAVCAVHRPSKHSMSEFPQSLRRDSGLIERVCPHGVGHPDPDSIAYFRDVLGVMYKGVHGCDGCCMKGPA